MSENKNEQHIIALLSEKIRQSFPNEIYSEKITPSDGGGIEADELTKALWGAKWSDVPPVFIRSHPDGLLLLTDGAFKAFLPAWLTESLTCREINGVREFLIYMFSPKNDMPTSSSSSMTRRMRYMSLNQISATQSVLQFLAQREDSDFVRNHAKRAIAFLKTLSADPPWDPGE